MPRRDGRKQRGADVDQEECADQREDNHHHNQCNQRALALHVAGVAVCAATVGAAPARTAAAGFRCVVRAATTAVARVAADAAGVVAVRVAATAVAVRVVVVRRVVRVAVPDDDVTTARCRVLSVTSSTGGRI